VENIMATAKESLELARNSALYQFADLLTDSIDASENIRDGSKREAHLIRAMAAVANELKRYARQMPSGWLEKMGRTDAVIKS
jgi:hypothetical protein